MTTIGIVHPGSMGATIGATAAASATVIWAGDGRSAASTQRATEAGMINVGSMANLCADADIVISICPPAAARAVAAEVVGHGFAGTYVDANAVAPETSAAIGRILDGAEGDIRYVDGGVIGPPATSAGTTRMYVAGPGAADLATIWEGSALEVKPLGEDADGGPASALKMAYAGWTKGQSALLLGVQAMAADAGVLEWLREEWGISQPGLLRKSDAVVAGVSPKAWRFSGEMEEIATTMAAAGLPDGFHRAAALLYQRMAEFKDQPDVSIDQAVDAILDTQRPQGTSIPN